MSWWGSVKNIYGLIMGTSTDWMKPSRRAHWPTTFLDLDDGLHVFLGGTGNCGILNGPDGDLYINCNSGLSAEKLFSHAHPQPNNTLVGTSNFPDYVGGWALAAWKELYLPETQVTSFKKGFEGSSLSSSRQQTLRIQWTNEVKTFPWGDEEVSIIPVDMGFSEKDLLVYLHRRQILFTGGIFFNGIHPVLDKDRGRDPRKWLKGLRQLQEFLPGEVKTYVPHEGDLCDASKVSEFCDYLENLMDPDVEFSQCRKDFDWIEIPGYTSLEENFNFLRK